MRTKEDQWWDKDGGLSLIATLIQYMIDEESVRDSSEIAYIIRKPWKYTNELNKAEQFYQDKYDSEQITNSDPSRVADMMDSDLD